MTALRRAAQDAMKPLAWMVGEWEGPASIEHAPGQTIRLTQLERLEAAAFNTAVLIQGRGTLKNGSTEQVVFESAGIMTYDVNSKKYIMTSTPGSGHAGTFDMKVEGTTVLWGFARSSTEHVRFEISQTADGKWKELGYVSADGGKTWKQNMEMLLSRKP